MGLRYVGGGWNGPPILALKIKPIPITFKHLGT